MSILITDIHAHVLPGLDDGPANADDSRVLLEAFSAQGTHRVIATPHFFSPHFDVTEGEILRTYHEVKNIRGSVEIGMGAEVRLVSSLAEIIVAEKVPTLGDTRYVLVEFRSDVISAQEMLLIHELCIRGYIPVMAHPERNLAVQKNPVILDELIDRGVIMQLTANCFRTHKRDKRMAEKTAWKILKRGCKVVIASDAHNCTTRPPGLQFAYDNIALRLGIHVADLLIENANAIWSNEPVNELPKSVEKRRIIQSVIGRMHKQFLSPK